MRFLLPLIVVLLAACQSVPPLPVWQSPEGLEHADLGMIIDLRSGMSLTPQQLLDELAGSDQVLVGERHDNPDHHALQLWLLQALAQQREQGSVLLEMLNPDQQQKVAQVQGLINQAEPPADLPAALGWQQGWDWALYAPLVEYGLAQPYPLLHANLDRTEISSIYRDVPSVTGAPSAPHVQALLEQIRASHCQMLPETQLPAMLAVQQQRDKRMAQQLAAAPKPAVLLAGTFHVRRDLGVPLYLQEQASVHDLRVLILAEVGEAVRAEQADFVWFTPSQPQQDHCAKWRDKAE